MGKDYPAAIAASGFTIYDQIEVGHPDLWVPTPELESLLDARLRGTSLAGLALRSRSKAIKEHVCRALGYPVPPSFRKARPRFIGQMFDTYAQKANNLQVWNEELSPSRRYVILKIDEMDRIARVRVVSGADLAKFDVTGVLTQKYQARLVPGEASEELVAKKDTDALSPHVRADADVAAGACPTDYPVHGLLLPIAEVFRRLRGAVGRSIADPGRDQERNRGALLHRMVCELLGYADYRDDGRFPDVPNQLLEIKLQTSPTIDLGLARPDSEEPLDIPEIGATRARHRDVRYAVFHGERDGANIRLARFYMTTGAEFYSRFPQFQGKVLNKKLQIRLPSDFFDG